MPELSGWKSELLLGDRVDIVVVARARECSMLWRELSEWSIVL